MVNVNTNIRMTGTEQGSVYIVISRASGGVKGTHPYSARLEQILDKEINKELPEDDLIEDRNMLECFLKCFK